MAATLDAQPAGNTQGAGPDGEAQQLCGAVPDGARQRVTMSTIALQPQAMLFDLGGVLLDWPGIAGLVDIAQGAYTVEDARQRWLSSRWVREHETGACSTAQFARGMVTEFKPPVTAEEFLAAEN